MPSQSVSSGPRSGPRTRQHPVRVAIDLETTGLNAESDAIIEIGAVKFSGYSVLDRMDTLVAPTAPLPYRIQRLTGITPASLRHAPTLHAVHARVRAFVGDAPLVGHNVAFDAAFLRRAGLCAQNPLIDTYELASMLLPTLSSYSLASVGDALGLHRDESHRALADADLARRVLLALLERLNALETGPVEDLLALPAARDWSPGFLLRQELRSREAPAGNAFAGLLTTSLGDQLARRLDVHPGALSLAGPSPRSIREPDAASPGDTSQSGLPASPRRAAVDAHMTRVLKSGGALLLEIEHDVEGLAASVEAALRESLASHERLVIAVADADALRRLTRDVLPLARASLRASLGDDAALRVAEIAQRDAYVCLWRWFGVARAPNGYVGAAPAELTRGLSKLVVWTRTTATGMRADVALSGQETLAWERVRAGREFTDSTATCPYGKGGYCYLTAAQAEVNEATVVLTTHAALAASLAATDDLVPVAPRTLILDAHTFEDALRETRSFAIDRARLHGLFTTLAYNRPNGRHGLLHAASEQLQQTTGRPDGQRGAEREWFEQVARARRSTDALFEALRPLVSTRSGGGATGGTQAESGEQRVARIDGDLRRSSGWRRAESAWHELAAAIQSVVATAREAATKVTLAEKRAPGSGSGVPLELLGVARQLDRIHSAMAGIFDDETDDGARIVSWLRVPYANQFDRHGVRDPNAVSRQRQERGGKPLQRPDSSDPQPRHADVASNSAIQIDANDPAASGQHATQHASQPQQPSVSRPDEAETDTAADEAPVLHSAAISVEELVAPLLMAQRALVLASPSLAVAGDFEYVRGALKLPDSTTVASLITDRVDQTLLALPSDVPEPNAPRYQRALEDTLIRLATALDGRLVALFPSHAALRSAYNGIRRALEAKNILVLGQGQDGSVRQLWQSFATEQRVVLLGAGAFWDGSLLRRQPAACVVVTKLPFPAMSDPLLAARAEQWDDAQRQFVVPQAALKLRQALSGLAWSHTQRNAVVLFDRRVQTRGYGSSIVGSLPRCTQMEEPVDTLTERIAEWVGPAKVDGA